jgi:hypothetical protein
MGKIELLDLYQNAKRFVNDNGFEYEGMWQNSLDPADLCESDLLRESAWVVLCSGFRESVVRSRFDYISLCFFDWNSASEIVRNSEVCRRTALVGFANERKIDAIVAIAERIDRCGFAALKGRILSDAINELQRFPFVGPITAYHLAKNLGFPYAKPDRHLMRLVQKARMNSAQMLCVWLAGATGDTVPYVDLVLWRYLASSGEASLEGI